MTVEGVGEVGQRTRSLEESRKARIMEGSATWKFKSSVGETEPATELMREVEEGPGGL